MPNRDWTDAEDQRLTTLATDHSYNAIAVLLHRTKNSIIGRAHRLHLPTRKPVVEVSDIGPERPPAPEPHAGLKLLDRRRLARPPPVAAPAPPPPSPIPHRRAECCCSWPFGEPGAPGFHYCEAPVERGSFCRKHAARAYLRTPPLDLRRVA